MPNFNTSEATYRVSVKALVRNDKGDLLVCRGIGETEYEMPGGGIEVGETTKQALARELEEELGFTGKFEIGTLFSVNTNFKNGLWRMGLYFYVDINTDKMHFSKGKDSSDVKFLAPKILADSTYFNDDTAEKLRKL